MVGDVDVSLLAGRASARTASVPLSLDLPPPSDCLVWLPRRPRKGLRFWNVLPQVPREPHAVSAPIGVAALSVPPASPGDPTGTVHGHPVGASRPPLVCPGVQKGRVTPQRIKRLGEAWQGRGTWGDGKTEFQFQSSEPSSYVGAWVRVPACLRPLGC